MTATPQRMVLVHSPFLGPASMRPLAEQLDSSGMPVLVPDLRGAMAGEPVHDRLLAEFADAASTVDARESLVLIGHSGAGPLLPGFAAATGHAVTALVYLDAGPPTPGSSWRDSAPAELFDEMCALARDARLPRWHQWFEADPLATLVPDHATRDTLAGEEPEVPIAFLTEPRPDADWTGPAGYLQLSPPYAAAADEAEQQGWPVRRVESHHLAAVTGPRAVADELLALLAALPARE